MLSLGTRLVVGDGAAIFDDGSYCWEVEPVPAVGDDWCGGFVEGSCGCCCEEAPLQEIYLTECGEIQELGERSKVSRTHP